MIILQILFALGLIFAGRNFYWFFVGVLGFLVGSALAPQYLPEMDEILIIGISLLAGIIGAVLAAYLQRFVVGIIGFFGGAQIMLGLFTFAGFNPLAWGWVPIAIGATVIAIASVFLYDWALIVLSAFGGATYLVQALGLQSPLDLFVLLASATVGIMIQAWMMMREKDPTARY
jgi:hypothetical protein